MPDLNGKQLPLPVDRTMCVCAAFLLLPQHPTRRRYRVPDVATADRQTDIRRQQERKLGTGGGGGEREGEAWIERSEDVTQATSHQLLRRRRPLPSSSSSSMGEKVAPTETLSLSLSSCDRTLSGASSSASAEAAKSPPLFS